MAQDCPQSSPWPLATDHDTSAHLERWLGWPGAWRCRHLWCWPLSPEISTLACLCHWSLSEAGHWCPVTGHFPHSSVLQSGSAHTELVTVSSLLSLGPGRLETGRGATDTHSPPSLHWLGAAPSLPAINLPWPATWAKWAKMLGDTDLHSEIKKDEKPGKWGLKMITHKNSGFIDNGFFTGWQHLYYQDSSPEFFISISLFSPWEDLSSQNNRFKPSFLITCFSLTWLSEHF